MPLPTSSPLAGRTALITGGTAGIGLVTARRLAALGAEAILVARKRDRGEAAARAISAEANVKATFVQADVSSATEIRRLRTEIETGWNRLDILVNNAGVMFGKRTLSADGIEMTFAVNHLAYFLLTSAMMPMLRASAPARIVIVASEAHRRASLDFSDLQGARSYRGWRTYQRSKLANLLFTYALAPRLDPERITVNALHPGFVATNIGSAHGFVPGLVWRLASLAAISPEKGAETPVYLASSPAVAEKHGRYFDKCQPIESSPASLDPDAQTKLWAESLRLTGIEEASFFA